MKQSQILVITFLIAAFTPVNAKSHVSEQPPNILFIAIDDLKPIGSVFAEDPGNFLQRVYPDKKLRTEVARRMTPNIQRLADKGITFMNAYCAAPACNPSRAALMTGIRPHRTGLITNAKGTFFRDFEYEGVRPLENAVTMPEHLRKNGWYTASTGKIYHSTSDYKLSDGPRSWTDWTNVKGGAGEQTDSIWRTDALAWGQEGGDMATYQELNDFRKADFMARVLENGEARDGNTTFSINTNQPFFLALGIFRPHLPFFTTKDLIDLFPVEEMSITRELLEEFIADGDDVPEAAFTMSGLNRDKTGKAVMGSDRFTHVLEKGLTQDAKDGDLKAWKDMLMHYFASCAIADRAVGRVLDGLENSPYKDNTMVILWSDHGYHLGEKLHVSKFAMWDDAAQVNYFIKDPRYPQNAGQRCYRPVSLIDLYPTVMNLADLDLPSERITGHDITPLLKNPRAAWKVPTQTTHGSVNNNMIRSERHKLIQYKDGSRELYDMKNDPEEFNNLAGKPRHKKVEAQMETIHNIAIAEGSY
jgi:arylsulfatase A-like enzyme